VVETSIFQGFRLTALACALLCGGAVILVFFMRIQARNKESATAAQEEEPRLLSLSE